MTSWVFDRRFVLDCHDFLIAQWIECSIVDSILVAASVHFASVASVRIALDSCDLGLTIGFVKTVE